jgi:hypothetical protein
MLKKKESGKKINMFNNLMSKFIDNHAPLIYLFEIRILKITKI